jgi:glycosyltransferase involved in cell wall biosynthesis
MKLSIIIPTKNEEQNLPVLLAALRAQTLFQRLPQEIEIIVADAHSTDATRALAIQAGARVVDGGMPGPGRNRGAEAATAALDAAPPPVG